MQPVKSLSAPPPLASPFAKAAKKPGDAIEPFAELLGSKVGEVNRMQRTADDKVHALLTGEDVNEAEVLTAVQKADLAFRMLMQIRNKLMDAYREVQQIQI